MQLLLIDAYNLLHHSDVMGRGRGVGWLQRARQRLIDRLVQHLGAELAQRTCLVFDAPNGVSEEAEQQHPSGMTILFAVNHQEADDLLEELLAKHSAPKRLTVISSDHRLQRAAQKRGAAFFDADLWYETLMEKGPQLGIPWPPREDAAGTDEAGEKPSPQSLDPDLANPFPEGYGEDLLDGI